MIDCICTWWNCLWSGWVYKTNTCDLETIWTTDLIRRFTKRAKQQQLTRRNQDIPSSSDMWMSPMSSPLRVSAMMLQPVTPTPLRRKSGWAWFVMWRQLLLQQERVFHCAFVYQLYLLPRSKETSPLSLPRKTPAGGVGGVGTQAIKLQCGATVGSERIPLQARHRQMTGEVCCHRWRPF